MSPLIQNGTKVELRISGTGSCQIGYEIGDIVAYKYGWNKHPLIKMIRADDKSVLEITKSGGLWIDGKTMKNSEGHEYLFTPGEQNMIGMYIKNGHIPTDSYLLFGDNASDSIDSRKFWAVSSVDFIGKFKK